LAPVFSFAQSGLNGTNRFVAGGNFYGVNPYEGRYDAMQPTVFDYDKKTKTFGKSSVIKDFEGEVRDMKWIKSVGGKSILLVARSNNDLKLFSANQ